VQTFQMDLRKTNELRTDPPPNPPSRANGGSDFNPAALRTLSARHELRSVPGGSPVFTCTSPCQPTATNHAHDCPGATMSGLQN